MTKFKNLFEAKDETIDIYESSIDDVFQKIYKENSGRKGKTYISRGKEFKNIFVLNITDNMIKTYDKSKKTITEYNIDGTIKEIPLQLQNDEIKILKKAL